MKKLLANRERNYLLSAKTRKETMGTRVNPMVKRDIMGAIGTFPGEKRGGGMIARPAPLLLSVDKTVILVLELFKVKV